MIVYIFNNVKPYVPSQFILTKFPILIVFYHSVTNLAIDS